MKLTVEDLTCVRGERVVLAGLGFAVAAGEALVLTGPNGAGKTTLIRTIAGFLRPGAGRVAIVDGDPEKSVAEQCHYVGHSNAVRGSLTVGENAHFWGGYLASSPSPSPSPSPSSPSPLVGEGRGGGKPRVAEGGIPPTPDPSTQGGGESLGPLGGGENARPQMGGEISQAVKNSQAEAIAATLARFGLGGLEDVPAAYLSAGQKRRLGLARLLLAWRPVWLLDEPTVSLDAAGQKLLAEVADAHAAAGGIVIAATHIPLAIARSRELRLGEAGPAAKGAP